MGIFAQRCILALQLQSQMFKKPNPPRLRAEAKKRRKIMFEIETEEYFVSNDEEEKPRQELDFDNPEGLNWTNEGFSEYED